MLIKFPPTLSEYQERWLKSNILDWCMSNGLMLAQPDEPGRAHAVPVTLYPSPFSRHGFDNALEIQTAFNRLYHAVVNQPQFVVDELSRATSSDDEFTLRLLDIYRKTVDTRTQHLTGGLFRSDYLVDRARTSTDEGRQIKQVEFNTVSVSFASLATRVTQLHNYMAQSIRSSVHGEVPISNSLTEMADGLAALHRAYDAANAQTLVLFIVQPGEANVADQRMLEYEMFARHKIVGVRVTLEQVSRKTTLSENNRLVFVPLGLEVSVVYFRSGYGPNDYPTDVEWMARERLERSHAIQCPSVLTQLAGTKKMQQLLTIPEVVEKLDPDLSEQQLAALRKTFVGIWPLDDSPRGLEGRKLAFDMPDRYVLKPQREGGGNNVYGDDIPDFLRQIDVVNWSNYILMELIEPPKISNTILKNGELVSGRIVSELGVFGTVLWDLKTGEELRNKQAGFLLRTKLQSSNEGGIAAGFGCLDAVQLPSR